MKIPKIIKNLVNEDNKIKLIGLLTILIFLWLILYFIPEIINSLFATVLGNLILIIIVILVSSYNKIYGITLLVVLIVLYRMFKLSNIKEGFQWDPSSTKDFLLIQGTINRNTIFDVNLIQENQASQEELDYFLKNGEWPWSQKVKDLYIEATYKNPYIRTFPADALHHAMTIYNQAAILKVLSYQTKEGQFLINGVLVKNPSGNKMEDLPSGYGNFGYNSGQIENKSDDVIKCNMSKDNGATLERIKYTGKGGIFNQQTKTVTPVDYNDLESIIPGFTFINGPCNPCDNININSNYSCKFKLSTEKEPSFISSVWQYLWGTN